MNMFQERGIQMRVTKTEKIWLIVVALLYGLYNFPGVPAYNDSNAMFIHAALTVVPLWIAVYIGMAKVYKIYKIKDQKKEAEEI